MKKSGKVKLMDFKERTILISLTILFAIIIIPGVLADNSCVDCHGKLTVFNESEQKLNDIRLKHLALNVPCSLECHTNTLEKFAIDNYDQWSISKHAMYGITCDKCHGGNATSSTKEVAHAGIKLNNDPTSPIYYTNVPETCGKCHSKELEQFTKSLHYQNLKALKQAPTCDTCHNPHQFKVVDKFGLHVLCSNCHNTELNIAPDVPDKATLALENVDKLKIEINIAENAINITKNGGKDVTAAQKDLDNAKSVLDGLPVLWHGFNLTSFENVISTGIESAQKAQQEAGIKSITIITTGTTTKPSTPGFEAVLSIAGLVVVCLLIRRLKR
jgi:hypothetical protein